MAAVWRTTFSLCLVWSNEQDSATESLTYTTVSAVCCQKILSFVSQMKYSRRLRFTFAATTAVANEPEHKDLNKKCIVRHVIAFCSYELSRINSDCWSTVHKAWFIPRQNDTVNYQLLCACCFISVDVVPCQGKSFLVLKWFLRYSRKTKRRET